VTAPVGSAGRRTPAGCFYHEQKEAGDCACRTSRRVGATAGCFWQDGSGHVDWTSRQQMGHTCCMGASGGSVGQSEAPTATEFNRLEDVHLPAVTAGSPAP